MEDNTKFSKILKYNGLGELVKDAILLCFIDKNILLFTYVTNTWELQEHFAEVSFLKFPAKILVNGQYKQFNNVEEYIDQFEFIKLPSMFLGIRNSFENQNVKEIYTI